jgi:hypothetical protein
MTASARDAVAWAARPPAPGTTCRDDVEVKWPGEWSVISVESEECSNRRRVRVGPSAG